MLNLRLNTVKAGFDPKIFHVASVVEEVALGQGLLRELRISLYMSSKYSCNQNVIKLNYKTISENPAPTNFKQTNLHKTATF